MKVLLTNHSLGNYTGSESWMYAMATQLSKSQDVSVYTNVRGRMSEKLSDYMVEDCNGDYDLALVNHVTTYDLVHCPKIFTSHSTIHEIERPPCKKFVGVNERIAQGNTVIRNGIDCKRFKPTKVNKKLENILYLSNPAYSGGRPFMEEACKGYNLITLDEQVFDIEKYIDKADLVISMARGALEAMACGKNVIYGDFRRDWMKAFKSKGMITKENFDVFKTGYATTTMKRMTPADLREEFKKYDSKRGEWLRQQVEEDFNIEKTAEEYLCLHTKKDI